MAFHEVFLPARLAFGSTGGIERRTEVVTLGVADGALTAFSLRKRYGDQDRDINKPVTDSVRVAVGGVELAPGAFEVDHATGRVTLDAAPGTGTAVASGFLFDTPVRFDADRIEVTLESFGAGRMAAVPLIEVRI